MKKVIVVACSRNRVIGKDNQLVWHMPADLRFFKKTTMGHHLLLGRKTFESMGGPLPGRTSIVITRNHDYKVPDGHYVVHSLKKGYELGEKLGLDDLMILGGAEIYKQALGDTDEIIQTYIDEEFAGDAFFPELDLQEWELLKRESHLKDEKNAHNYEFRQFVRRQNKE
jgi:dihydrofolate reductase